jgi:glutathione S-transferase
MLSAYCHYSDKNQSVENKMIKLHAPNSINFGLPSASPFVIKAMILLKMANIEYKQEDARPMEGPKQKIPFITAENGEKMGDSYFIKKHIENHYNIDFNKDLDAKGRALSLIIERMCDDHLYWLVVYYRWCIDENFNKGPSHFFDPIPQPMQNQIREATRNDTMNRVHGMGISRHSPQEILMMAKDDIAAIANLLGDNLFILGDEPCAADASLYGHLAAFETPFFEIEAGDYIRTKPNLMEYLKRMRELYFG